MLTVTSRTDKEKSECYVQFVFGSTEYEHFDAHDDTTYPRNSLPFFKDSFKVQYSVDYRIV